MKIVKNKKYLIIIISIIVIIFLILIYLLNYKKDNNTSNNELYAVIKEVENNYIVIKPDNDNISELKITRNDANNYNIGDFVLLTYDGDILTADENNINIDILMKNNEYTTNKEEIDIINTQNVENTTSKLSSTSKTTTKELNTTNDYNLEIVNYVANIYEKINNKISNSFFKEEAKEDFISIIDFIFYDGTIKGHTFSELKDSSKAKIIYYALLIDNKINYYFPEYKEEIKDKYEDIKAKLIASYLDLSSSICSNTNDDCKSFKSDFNLLKTSLNLTWDSIKVAFTYAKNKKITKLESWYQTFRSE